MKLHMSIALVFSMMIVGCASTAKVPKPEVPKASAQEKAAPKAPVEAPVSESGYDDSLEPGTFTFEVNFESEGWEQVPPQHLMQGWKIGFRNAPKTLMLLVNVLHSEQRACVEDAAMAHGALESPDGAEVGDIIISGVNGVTWTQISATRPGPNGITLAQEYLCRVSDSGNGANIAVLAMWNMDKDAVARPEYNQAMQVLKVRVGPPKPEEAAPIGPPKLTEADLPMSVFVDIDQEKWRRKPTSKEDILQTGEILMLRRTDVSQTYFQVQLMQNIEKENAEQIMERLQEIIESIDGTTVIFSEVAVSSDGNQADVSLSLSARTASSGIIRVNIFPERGLVLVVTGKWPRQLDSVMRPELERVRDSLELQFK